MFPAAADPDDAPSRDPPPSSGSSPPPPSDRDKLIHNEQTKLTATLINGVALAFLVGGGVATMLGLGNQATEAEQLVRALVWILTGFILHGIARLFLRYLL
ncbi:hypothetical protein [Methylobacterium nodulans]|nr:hypothetical protein [Methylobacterium nodulans]